MAYNPYINPYFQPPMGAAYGGAMPDALAQMKNPYQQPMQPPAVQAPSDMLWVLGEIEAQSYPVAPNNTVTLWDKNQPTIYIKSVNAQGVPSIRILDFTERTANCSKMTENGVRKSNDKFVEIEAFDALRAEIDELRLTVDELKAKPAKKTAKGSDE